MAQKLNIFSGRQFLDANGDPYSGARLFVYTAGSSTKAAVTKDSAGVSAHDNPIILNTRGEPGDGAGASQAIWQTEGETIKLVLAPSTDTDPPVSAISTWDNLSGINDTTVSIDQWVGGPTPTFIDATSFSLVGDQTSDFHVGRRVKTTNSGGTVYSTIITSAYTSLTTITVANDGSSVLDSGLSAVSYGLLSADNSSISSNAIVYNIGPDIASATALPYPAYGNYSDVTGTTAITSIGTSGIIGTPLKLHFDGILTLTHHATDLILPGAANITTAAGDEAEFVEYASGDWRCVNYSPISGSSAIPPTPEQGSSLVFISTVDASNDATIDITGLSTTYDDFIVMITDVVPATDGAAFNIRVGDSGSYRSDSTYQYHMTQQTNAAATYSGHNSSGNSVITLATAVGNTGVESYSGWVRINNPASASSRSFIKADGSFVNSGGAMTNNNGTGVYTGSVFAIDRLRFLMSTGNITSGTFSLYGVRKS